MQHGVEVQVEDMNVKKDPDGAEGHQQGLKVVRPRIGYNLWKDWEDWVLLRGNLKTKGKRLPYFLPEILKYNHFTATWRPRE